MDCLPIRFPPRRSAWFGKHVYQCDELQRQTRAHQRRAYATVATGVATTNYTDTVAAGMKWYYVVSAVVGGVETPNSAEATIGLPHPVADAGRGCGGTGGQRDLQQWCVCRDRVRR